MADKTIMDWAILEKMAGHETGRMPVSAEGMSRGRMIVFPRDLSYQRPLLVQTGKDRAETFFLDYPLYPRSSFKTIGDYLKFTLTLFKYLPVCRKLDLFVFSDRNNWLCIILTAIMSRLLGLEASLHDYRFRTDKGGRLTRILYPLCQRLEVGDITAVTDERTVSSDVLFRSEASDLEAYAGFRKSRAVPRVIIYGDFESRRVISLVVRTHELIKQKYPRTEFILAPLTSHYENYIDPGSLDSSIIIKPVDSEASLKSQFSDSDIVMLLSPGGLNRCFLIRAREAGYPVIANDLNYPEDKQGVISVPRDSYSGLAEAVIRLVDDDAYYQSFGSLRGSLPG
jgi:hypothetical protein